MIHIQLDKIDPNPWQTRSAAPPEEYIQALAADIAANGLLQIPIGRPHPEDGKRVQLAFGHNRLAAYAHLANSFPGGSLLSAHALIPVEVRELTDEQMANFAWSENEKRRDVTAIERAHAIERRMTDFGWSNRQAAEALGIDHSTISNILRLLKLPEKLQTAIQEGKLSERAAQSILVLFDLPEFTETYYLPKRDILRSALGGASSDYLRDRVDQYLIQNGRNLSKAEFSLTHLFPEGRGVYCGTCSTCDKRLPNRNLCFDRQCFDEKTERVHLLYLANASLASGFSILDPEKAGNPSDIDTQYLETIKAAKCPNLVLAYGDTSYEAKRVPGFPKAHLVCEKRNQSCSCIKGLRANLAQPAQTIREVTYVPVDEEIPQDGGGDAEEVHQITTTISSADLEEAARQARKDKREAIERQGEIVKLVAARLVEALRADQVGVFYLIAHRHQYPPRDLPALEDLYNRIAHELTLQYLMPGSFENLTQMLEIVNRNLERLQIEPVGLGKTLAEVFGIEMESIND